MALKITLTIGFSILLNFFCFSQPQITEINEGKIEISKNNSCKEIIRTKLDNETFQLSFNTIPIDSDGMTLYWKLDNSSGHTLVLRIKNFQCVESSDRYRFIFEDQAINLENIVPENCLGYAGFKPTKKELAVFAKNSIESIEIRKADKSISALSFPQAKEFSFHCDCVDKVELN